MNSAKRKLLKRKALRDKIDNFIIKGLSWAALLFGSWFILWTLYWCILVLFQWEL